MRTSKLQNKCDMKISRSKVISFRETRENPTSLTCTHCSFRLHFWQILNVFKQYSLCWCLFHYLTNQNRSQEKITLTAEPTCCKQHCESKLFIANHFPFLSSFQPSPSGKLTNKNKFVFYAQTPHRTLRRAQGRQIMWPVQGGTEGRGTTKTP